MMKQWWHYLLLGVAALLLFLVMRFPAPVAYSLAADNLGGQVKLAGVTGTLWQGEAQQLQYQNSSVATLNWQLSPWGLLLGKLSGDVSLNQDDAYLQTQFETSLSGGEISLSQIEGRLPLPLIQPYLSHVPLPLQGMISLKMEELLIDSEDRPQRATGRVVWHQAGVSAPQQLLFGDLQMSLSSSKEGGIEGTISDSGGPLQLRANISLGTDGAYQLTGQVKAAESAPKNLRHSLSMLGKVNAEGFYALDFSGVI